MYIWIYYLCYLFIEMREREGGREMGREGGREKVRAEWRDFSEKKQNSIKSIFNGGVFHFSQGCSVSKLIENIAQ